jgi:gluconate 2-dehydrogenase gamma chain
MNYNRRKFIKLSCLAVGATGLAVSCKINYPGYYFFTEEEAACIIAICEQIIPADDDPGATDAGVVYYIDKQLTEYFKEDQSLYRNGIIAIQTSCMNLYGSLFEQLDSKKQLEFLKNMEKGRLEGEEWGEVRQAGFFSTLLNHTMQGFYGSPRHGGNKDYVSYTMMGMEYPQVLGRNVYHHSSNH